MREQPSVVLLPHSRSARLLQLAAVLALVLSAVSCKKGTDAVEPVAGKKPPIVKAKKTAKAGDPAEAEAPGTPTPTAAAPAAPDSAAAQRASVRAPEAVTPIAAPAAAAPAPIVPKVPDSAKPALVAKPPEPAKAAEPGKTVEPAKPARVLDAVKPPEPPKAPEAPKPAKAPVREDDAPVPPGGAVVRPAPSEPPLDLTGYLSTADLEKVLGAKQRFRRAELPGVPPSPGYNAQLFASDKPNELGVTIQVWRDPNLAESRTRYNTMKNAYSNVTPSNKITDMGFRAWYGPVVTQVFVDPRRPLLGAVSCSAKVCNGEQLIELARRVAERLR